MTGARADNSPPMAHALMSELGLLPATGYWFIVQPAHFHVARDHLVLTDLRHLQLDDVESRALFESVLPSFTELRHELRYGDARRWFMRADSWQSLRTTTPDAATGHNVDIWMPSGERSREWRKLHNEVQMLWHAQALNDQLEQLGKPRVNGLWLWGGASAIDRPSSSGTSNQIDDALISHALAGDWASWLAAMANIDTVRVAPLMAALRSGQLDRLTLRLTDASRVRSWQVTRASLMKFWARPSLTPLSRASA